MTKPMFMDPRDAELVVETLGALPRAPLPMPKQHLEYQMSWLARLWHLVSGALVIRRVRH